MFLWFLILLACPVFANEREDREMKDLEKAEELFQGGNFHDAQNLATSLWENAALSESDEQYRISVLLCRISYVFKKEQDTDKWFERLYRQKREFVFDVYVDPPELHERWKKFRDKKDEESRNSVAEIAKGLRKKSKAWVGLIPFGVGHFDFERYPEAVGFAAVDAFSIYLIQSGSRKSSRADDAQTIADPKDSNVYRQGVKQSLAGALIFVGSWGYQIAELAPDIYSRDRSMPIDSIRYGLSFVPFGVGQYKNRQYKKAWLLGGTQFASLAIGMFSERDSLSSSMGYLGFAISYAYGIYDGWYHHEDKYPNYEQTRMHVTPWVLPTASFYGSDQNSLSLGMSAQIAF